ncbi:nuclease [Rhizoclosmatium sp. JEL0117]|nr:nuclease [Rhizoclosmatium sp. JEL0117]
MSTKVQLTVAAATAAFAGFHLGRICDDGGLRFPWPRMNEALDPFVKSSLTFSMPNLVSADSASKAAIPTPPMTNSVTNQPRNVTGSFGVPGPTADLLVRTSYIGAFDRRLRNVHWVAEKLTKDSIDRLALSDASLSDTEESKPDRKHSTFKEDPAIPLAFRVKPNDYTNSGFDRGHLVPAADVVESQAAIDETFFMSNMSPQAPAFNRGVWASFERYVRGLVKSFDEVYVITGPMYLPKQDPEDGKFYVKYEVIGRDKTVAVPTHFFKVILGVKNGSHYMGSFVLANEGVAQDTQLDSFLLPVEAIERSTGLEFFPFLERRSVKALCSAVKCSFKLASKYRANSASEE